MSYTLEIDKLSEVVNVKATCALNNAIRKEILNDVAEHLKSTRYTKVIIDLTDAAFNSAEPIEGSVELAMYMSRIGITPEARLALIYADAEGHRKTFEKITQSVGYRLCYFKNVEEAYLWLEHA